MPHTMKPYATLTAPKINRFLLIGAGLIGGLLALGLCSSAQAKPSIFRWSDEVCLISGQYNPQKITATQLLKTSRLLQNHAPLFNESSHSQSQDDEELAVYLGTLSINDDYVSHPSIDVLRQKQKEQAQFWYDLTKIKRQVRESHDYAALAQFYPSRTQACLPIVYALSNTSEQLARARVIFTQECKSNADPKQCITRQMANPSSSLLNYSWHNCANSAQPEISSRQQSNANKAFLAQLTHIKRTECEEP